MTQEPFVEYSRPSEERRGTHLVLMLHGYGSNEQDLLGLLPALPSDGFTYASMRAPDPMPSGGPGFSWFDLNMGPEGSLAKTAEGAKAATSMVTTWIESHADEYADVTLLGFSQGMAIASSVARHRPNLLAAVVGLSGFVIDSDDESLDDVALAARTPRLPFFYGRDQEDPVVTGDLVAFTLDWLRDHTQVTKVLYAGMGHGVSNQEMKHVPEFLTYVLR